MLSVHTIEVLAGDFKKGSYHSFYKNKFTMKIDRKFFSVKIPASCIEELEVANEESVKRIGGTIGWGAAGAVVLGPAGLLAGLLLGGKKKEVTFVCKFDDGKKFLGKANSQAYEALLASIF